MTSSNRAAVISKIHRVLKKHFKPVAPHSGRTVLEHLLYACCLENAQYELADEAFAKVQQSYFDLNEVRVTTVSELCEVLDVLPDPNAAATNLKRALQAVFESHFDFNIEYLRKQNLGKSEKDLEKYTAGNSFLIGYVAQHGLSGHSIPCGRGELDVLMIAGLITEAEVEKRHVPGLERAIPKTKGIEFASLLHQLAADYVQGPNSSKIRAILLEIDPESKDRFPKRSAKKEEVAVDPRKKASPMAATAPRKKEPPTPPKDEKAERRSKDKRDLSKPSDPDGKKSTAKGLAKKKPR